MENDMTPPKTDSPDNSTEKTKRSFTPVSGVQGLYISQPNGVYHSRYSMNGKRCSRSLETTNFEVARLRHAKSKSTTEVARQSGVKTDSKLHTLGAIARYLESEIEAAQSVDSTKTQYHGWLKRLRDHWQQGDFDTTLARSVTRTTIVELRSYLSTEARPLCTTWKNPRKGYSPSVVNQTLTMLKIMLKTAVIKNVIAANPFSEESPFGTPLLLPRAFRTPEIPTNETLEQVFNDMAEVNVSGMEKTAAEYFVNHAKNSAEFARFLAYSGMRASEAGAAMVQDVRGNFLLTRGTKTETSRRQIPINAPLRALLDKIIGKRTSGPLLGVKSCLKALQRSCKRLGIAPLRQHDLRHYFATLSIESGVPIPTVADWLGHSDGGALLMKTYRHLRDRHSTEAAALIHLQHVQPISE